MTYSGKLVVWDWNGTLVHDIECVLRATNEALRGVIAMPLTLNHYRRQFKHPVRDFYDVVVGRSLSDSEWSHSIGLFLEHYEQSSRALGVIDEAQHSLQYLRDVGLRQSLLSLHPHARLQEAVRRTLLGSFFDLVEGSTVTGTRGKAQALRRHLHQLDRQPAEALLIGDSIDDFEAADQVGAQCILVAGGSCHSVDSLRRLPVPVVDSITEAAQLATQILKYADDHI